MMKIYRFLMVLGLLVWMAQNVSSQSRYDKDRLYNVFPAKVSNTSFVMLRCVFFTWVFNSPNRQLMLMPYLREG